MKIDLIKQLEKLKKDTRTSSDKVVDEVKLLLDQNAAEERNALKVSGLEQHIVEVENKKSVEIERNKFEDEYKGKVFTEAEIKKLCIKYDLRLLPTRRYAGKIDTQVASKLAKFIKDNESEIGHHSDSFYVMAPGSAFKLEDHPTPIRDVDPVLLYRIPRTNNFTFIHKWGKDFTVFRRIRGLFFESMSNMFWMSFAFYFLLFNLFAAIIMEPHSYLIIKMVIFGVCATCASFISLGLLFNDWDDWRQFTSENMWDSRLRRRK